MRIEFSPRPEADPVEQLVDGFIFLSGGVFQLMDRVAAAAHEYGFEGKVRLDVVTRALLDPALEPLKTTYEAHELERAAEILREATERIGRQFFSEQYADVAGE